MKNILFHILARLILLPVLLVLTILVCFFILILLPYTVTIVLCGLILIAEVAAWVMWVIKGLKDVEKTPLDPGTQKTIISVFVIICLAIFIYHQAWWFGKCVYTEESPCGNYTVKVYDSRGLFYMSMPGDGGNHPTKIVLKNKWGWPIGTGNDIINNMEIEWNYEYRTLYYSRGNGIDF